MKQLIHVAQDAIRKNTRDGTTDPAIIVRTGSKSTRHSGVDIVDKDGNVIGTFHYQPHKPLSCGARVFLSLNEDFCYARPHCDSKEIVKSECEKACAERAS